MESTLAAQHVRHVWPIVRASGDCEDGEFGAIKIGTRNRSTRRKSAPAPLCHHKFHLTRPGREPGPATNRLSYGAAYDWLTDWIPLVPIGTWSPVKLLHLFLWFAKALTSLEVFPISVISSSIVLLKVFLGRPLLPASWGVSIQYVLFYSASWLI
jgi:hypothetical protein